LKMSDYKSRVPLAKRMEDSARVRAKYPNRIPVIAERAPKCTLPLIDKNKYLVPSDLSVGHLVFVIRNRLKLAVEDSLFIFINRQLPASSTLLSALYQECADPDGFLYAIYSNENTFGAEDTVETKYETEFGPVVVVSRRE